MVKYWRIFRDYFSNRPLLVMILITVGCLVLFRVGSLVTIPAVNLDVGQGAATQSGFRDVLDLLGGGGLRRVSIFALGISPYITAQIITQLLSSDLIPSMARLAKSGERGRKRIDQISRLITLPFTVLQGFAVVNLLQTIGVISIADLSATTWVYLLSIMTAGTYLAIFLGDTITKRGVGNGMTLIIASGIIGNIIDDLKGAFGARAFTNTAMTAHILYFFLYLCFIALIIVLVIFINGSTRKIPIQRTGQALTTKDDKLPYLPIKVNAAGVIPVVFSLSIMSIPLTVAQILPQDTPRWIIEDYLSFTSWVGLAVYFVLTLLFAFMYSYIQINPDQLAENLQKNGSYVPGVRPGEPTVRHISRVLYRINWIGGPYIAIVATVPYIVDLYMGISSSASLGGTGLIIIVTACIETYKATKSANTATNYTLLRKELQTSGGGVSLW